MLVKAQNQGMIEERSVSMIILVSDGDPTVGEDSSHALYSYLHTHLTALQIPYPPAMNRLHLFIHAGDHFPNVRILLSSLALYLFHSIHSRRDKAQHHSEEHKTCHASGLLSLLSRHRL